MLCLILEATPVKLSGLETSEESGRNRLWWEAELIEDWGIAEEVVVAVDSLGGGGT